MIEVYLLSLVILGLMITQLNYDGRSISKLQNGVILLVFHI